MTSLVLLVLILSLQVFTGDVKVQGETIEILDDVGEWLFIASSLERFIKQDTKSTCSQDKRDKIILITLKSFSVSNETTERV